MQRSLLHQIVRQAISCKFENKEFDDTPYAHNKELQEQKACFVTLELDGNLRGCIGSLIAHRTLLQDLVHNAQSAAFEDPRFAPLTPQEFERLDIEISVLTTPQELPYTDIDDLRQKIIPHTHGVIIKQNSAQATFLPSVWQQLPGFDLFFSHLCQKAGLGSNCLEKKPQIYTYEAIKY
ncbi:MAG: AmmeMemoRadiSam system protein A [Campylobacterota bacterium]